MNLVPFRTLPACALIVAIGGCRKADPYAAVAKDLPAQMAAAEKEHVPLAISDIVPDVPNEKNAAQDYQRAFVLCPSTMPKSPSLPLPTSEAEVRDAERFLDAYRPILKLLDSATSKQYCVFPYRLDYGPLFELPGLEKVIWFAHILVLDAQVKAFHKDYAGAVARLGEALTVSEQIGQDPSPVPGLFAQTCANTALHGVLKVATIGGAEPGLVAGLMRLLVTKPRYPNLENMIGGDSVAEYLTLEGMSDRDILDWRGAGKFGINPEMIPPPNSNPSEVRDASLARLIERERNVMAIVRNSGVTPADKDRQIAAFANSIANDKTQGFNLITASVTVGLATSLSRTEAGREICLAGLRAFSELNGQRDFKSPPKSALTPQPNLSDLKWTPEPGGFRITGSVTRCSIAEDGKFREVTKQVRFVYPVNGDGGKDFP